LGFGAVDKDLFVGRELAEGPRGAESVAFDENVCEGVATREFDARKVANWRRAELTTKVVRVPSRLFAFTFLTGPLLKLQLYLCILVVVGIVGIVADGHCLRVRGRGSCWLL
jgi:hypothetical protein